MSDDAWRLLTILAVVGIIALLLFATNAAAVPLLRSDQCRIYLENIAKVEAWTDQRKNDLYLECISRGMNYKLASRLTVEESLELRKSWALTPVPDMGHD